MSIELQILLFAGLSGATVFWGGLLGWWFNDRMPEGFVKYEIDHITIAFGGGIILSAVALVLVPRGMEQLTLLPFISSFVIGALVFFLIDMRLAKTGGESAQLMAMLLDYIPESLALGAVFANDTRTGTLLALFVGAQNLPEAFNAYRELIKGGTRSRTILIMFFFLSFTGIIAAFLGHYFLRDHPDLTAHLMVFASGGILYLIFQDIAPKSKIKRSWIPSLGATLGFVVGVIGEKLM